MIEYDELADHGQERNQNDGAYLDDAVAAFGQHQQRPLELERDDNRKNHAEHGLEHGIFGGVEAAPDNAEAGTRDPIRE